MLNKKEGGGSIICLVLLLAVACYFDYRKAKIPNWLILVGLVSAVGITVWEADPGRPFYITLLWPVVRTAITTVILYPFFKIGVLGAGDVKLVAVCAAFLKTGDCVPVFVTGLIVAAIAGFCKLLFLGNTRERIYYLFSYGMDVVQFGVWKPYWTKENLHLKKDASLRMAGPLLAGVLLHICVN